jgi:hypothetical protein
MKLNRSMLVLVAVMVGSMSTMACKSNEQIKDTGNNAAEADSKAATPEDNPEAAAVQEASSMNGVQPGVERDARYYTYWVHRAPPALRVETRPVSPGAGHWWRPGYYGWSGNDYVWYGGRWYAPRAGYEYYHPRWHHVGGRWGYYPGHWYRR